MEKINNISGFAKTVFNIRIKLSVFFYFLKQFIMHKISFKKFIIILQRLLFFLSSLQHNKFVKIGNKIRMGLYIPGMSSPAFITAINKFAVFNEKLPNTTVLVSITSACRFKCEHCYQKNDKGKDLEIEKLLPVIKELQNMGVAFFNLEGGEPFLVFEKLKKVCAVIDERSEIWINSTGDGMTVERLIELKKMGLTALMFSLHTSVPEELNAFMKSNEAWKKLETGVKYCHEASVPVAFNICLQKQDFYNGKFERVIEKAKEFNAAIIQLIKPKPAGGWLESGVEEFSKTDMVHIKNLVNRYNLKKEFEEYPAISAQIIEESENMFGCTAGGTDRFYINAKGDVQPCEFLNISFGNIAEEEFSEIYKRMRKQFEIPGECWLCEKYSGEILKIKQKNKLETLPLDKKLSEQIYLNWDRGKPTYLYSKLSECGKTDTKK